MDIFKEAKKKSTKTKTKKEGVSVEVDKAFGKHMKRYAHLTEKMNTIKAESDVIKGILKDRGKEEFFKLYEDDSFPGSFDIVSGAASFKFIPVDRYLKIDEEDSDILKSKYGEDIVNEETKFSMNSKLIAKYGKVISDLITSCDDITESDKKKLISAKTTFSVKKGTLKELEKIDGKKEDIVEDVKPIFQIKNCKVETKY